VTVVLDTNVVVSALFFGGLPLDVVRACIAGKFRLLASPEILDEYREVAARFQEPGSTDDQTLVFAGLCARAVIVEPPPLQPPVCRDPFDDRFIACALAGHGDFIVTGDRDLLALAGRLVVDVLTPRQFLARLGTGT
jgi:putative PIN family toxin of toxin-antitoxin system